MQLRLHFHTATQTKTNYMFTVMDYRPQSLLSWHVNRMGKTYAWKIGKHFKLCQPTILQTTLENSQHNVMLTVCDLY